jgi:hypothetical protein
MPQSKLESDEPAERLTHVGDPLNLFTVQDGQDIGDEVVQRELFQWGSRPAEAPDVHGDAGVPRRKGGQLLPPGCGIGPGAMAQKDGGALPVAFVIDSPVMGVHEGHRQFALM